MNINLTRLKIRAAKSKPTCPRGKPGPVGRWTVLWPVYAELRERRFTIRQAVHWLIQEGAVPEQDRKKAEYGLPMVESRQRRARKKEAKTLRAAAASATRTGSRTRRGR
jgi:hypothetical protein